MMVGRYRLSLSPMTGRPSVCPSVHETTTYIKKAVFAVWMIAVIVVLRRLLQVPKWHQNRPCRLQAVADAVRSCS